MKNKRPFLYLFLIIGIIVALLVGCKDVNSPPSVSYVQKRYQEHSEDIQVIIDFLSSSDYEDVYISDSAGTMLADLNEVLIEDPSASKAIDNIIDAKAYQHINKNGNTISLLQWKGIRDIGCGIAYTINGIDAPEIEFATQIIPLSDDGWFYYVSDYNAWRNSQ
jgi:hypothetical protein